VAVAASVVVPALVHATFSARMTARGRDVGVPAADARRAQSGAPAPPKRMRMSWKTRQAALAAKPPESERSSAGVDGCQADDDTVGRDSEAGDDTGAGTADVGSEAFDSEPPDLRRSARLADKLTRGAKVLSGTAATGSSHGRRRSPAPGESFVGGVDGSNGTRSSQRAPTQDDMEVSFAEAAQWLTSADALVICSAREADVLRLCFHETPRLAWGFWGLRYRALHKGMACGNSSLTVEDVEVTRHWADMAPLGAFALTSDFDGLWGRAGWDANRIVEVDGSAWRLQCSTPCCDDTWDAPAEFDFVEDATTHHAMGQLPVCPRCGAVARPAAKLWVDDSKFSRQRLKEQAQAFRNWFKGLDERTHRQHLRIVCVEISGGLPPESGVELMQVLERFPSARVIRLGGSCTGASSKGRCERSIDLLLEPSSAIRELDSLVSLQAMGRFIVQDHVGTAAEVRAPILASPLHVLHILEKSGMEVYYKPVREAQAAFFAQWGITYCISLSSATPPGTFHIRRGEDWDNANAVTNCQVSSVEFRGKTCPTIVAGIESCERVLKALISEFSAERYRREVRSTQDRNSVSDLLRSVQKAVFPSHGLRANADGLSDFLSHIWIYGVCEPHVFTLANEVMQLSHMRLCASLPWDFGAMVLLQQQDRQERSRRSYREVPSPRGCNGAAEAAKGQEAQDHLDGRNDPSDEVRDAAHEMKGDSKDEPEADDASEVRDAAHEMKGDGEDGPEADDASEAQEDENEPGTVPANVAAESAESPQPRRSARIALRVTRGGETTAASSATARRRASREGAASGSRAMAWRRVRNGEATAAATVAQRAPRSGATSSRAAGHQRAANPSHRWAVATTARWKNAGRSARSQGSPARASPRRAVTGPRSLAAVAAAASRLLQRPPPSTQRYNTRRRSLPPSARSTAPE